MSPSPDDAGHRKTRSLRPNGHAEAEPGSRPFAALVAQLLEEMTGAWQRGERPTAADCLARHPQLATSPEEAIRLIYEEVCLRQDAGEAVDSAEIVGRFPQWRDQLEVVLHCHRLMEQGAAVPFFPEIGDTLGHLRLLAELGRGAQGRVFLAAQQDLADRPVVLKMTAGGDSEHLSLARMWQHTHIVPLYWEKAFPDRNLHVLCMPFLGGTTLARLLEGLRDRPLEQRTGRDLVAALDQAQVSHPVQVPGRGPARQLLASLAYPEAVCWLGVGLADALQYAHDRGLVHLDLKPANVLVASDGQPLLLDFHLAQEPVAAGPPPDRIGGTAGYMPPEQRAALAAVTQGQPIASPVDGRADVFALGAVLYEALGGRLLFVPGQSPALHRINRQVSVGLSDIVARCLAPAARDRYPRAGDLRADLLRHLHGEALASVANRSWPERWRKWRRRRPYAGRLAGMAAAIALVALAVAVGAVLHIKQRGLDAQAALEAGRAQRQDGNYAGAIQSLSHGLALAHQLPWAGDLEQRLTGELDRTRRSQVAHHLHEVADQVRFRFDAESPHELQQLDRTCREVWAARDRIMAHAEGDLGPKPEQEIRQDLLDLAILWAEVHGRLTAARGQTADRRQGLQVLDEAAQLLGPSPVLHLERSRYRQGLEPAFPDGTLAPQTGWDHYLLGRSRMLAGNLDGAIRELERAVELQPQEFWPHFYLGACAYRQGRFAAAVTAFTVCTVLAPRAAECFHNRALAHVAQGDTGRASRDFDRALELRPTLAIASLNRGLLHAQEQRYSEALTDLEQALDHGGDPVQVHYQMALVCQAQGEASAARTHLQQVLRLAPDHAAARQRQEQLLREH